MTPTYTYEIRFIDSNGAVIRTMPFKYESICCEFYDTLDTINAHLIPHGAVKAERHMITIAATATPRRRSLVSGQFKAAQ